MSYSSPAFLWANIHLLLIIQENNVQLFCLLLTENSVSWEEKEQTQLKNWVTLIVLFQRPFLQRSEKMSNIFSFL